MEIVAHAPYRARSRTWQPRPGAWALTVACHVVFDLAPRESGLSTRPLAAVGGDADDRQHVEPWAPVVPYKRCPEVVAVGHAHAPPGETVTSLLARLSVGEVDKVVRVQGDSYFTQTGALVGPAPFAHLPLRWDRAAGGPHTGNPEGVRTGPEALADTFGRVPLPNLRPAAVGVEARDQVIEPVGFAPLAPTRPARMARLGRHAATWSPARWAEWPLPSDVDPAYFNVAPSDQALAEITGTERIALEHLHPSLPRLVTYLRGAPPRVAAVVGGVSQPITPACDTLVIDADRGQAILVWRAVLAIDHPSCEGVVMVTTESGDVTSTVALGADDGSARAALPFQRGESSWPAPPAPRPSRSLRASTLVLSAEAQPAAALPFVATGAAPSEERVDPTLSTQVQPAMTIGAALPFAQRPEAEPEPEPITERHPTALRPSLPPAPAPPALVFAAQLADPPLPPALFVAPPLVEPPLVPPPPAVVEAAPPAEGEPGAEAAPLPPAPPRAEPTLPQVAAIDARLALRPGERRAALDAEELTETSWAESHARWAAEIDAELDRGRKKLLSEYDQAYVAALEAIRGPVTVDEYAALCVAAERGQAAAKLAELELPEASMMRLRRVWLTRSVKDPRLAAELRAATRAAREA